jgi:cyclopropane-fatty-acyl-phospholipid synthase
MNCAKDIIEDLLGVADLSINDDKSDSLHVYDNRFYSRVLRQGSLGLGESYMDGWWDCDKLDEFFSKALLAKLDERIRSSKALLTRLMVENLRNLQTPSRAFQIGEFHYDTGNDLFTRMLDRRMNYSCGYWADAKDLDQAQEAKLNLICKKLHLAKGTRLLDIGCGWGGLAKFAAEKYGVEVVGITVSKEQLGFANQSCHGLPVEIRLQDYRQLNERFDYIVSIGMFEHVGHKNYRTYMEVVNRCLANDGLFLLHTIGEPTEHGFDPWFSKYIFPNSEVPAIEQIASAANGLFVMEDWHNFGPDYDKTLLAWYDKFETHWPEISDRYGGRFFRMWRYYLLSAAAAFRARRKQLWQIVFSKHRLGRYPSVR